MLSECVWVLRRTQNTELCCPAVRMCVDTSVEYRTQNAEFCCSAVQMCVGTFVEHII